MLKTPETQIPTEELHEEPKSFDVMASVNMFRFDLENFGTVLPETKQRVYDEELTFVAEGIDRPLYTKFDLKEESGQLVYFNNGQWQPYKSSLIKGLRTAKREAEQDTRKTFLANNALRDLEMLYRMEGLEPGQSLKWYTPYAYKEEELYGADFLKQECGLQPARKMGIINWASKNSDGSVTLETHSVDNSNAQAFEAAMCSQDDTDIYDTVAVYDNKLSQDYGEEFYAGRVKGEIPEENAWDVLKDNSDLVDWYLGEIEALASMPNAFQLEKEKTLLTFGFWGAIKKRMDNSSRLITNDLKFADSFVPASSEVIAEEVRRATLDLASKGEQLVGCGGSVSVDSLSELDPDKARDAVFGGDKYGSRKFNCPSCGHENTRPHNKLLDKCNSCKGDVTC